MAVLGLTGLIGLGGCAAIAVWSASDKKPAPTTPAAKAANDQFWTIFHGGRYQDIAPVLDTLTAQYLANPSDATTAAHIGFLQAWRLSEHARENPRATVTDDIVVGRKYFAEAVRLDPDIRYEGFRAALELAEGSVHKDEKLLRRGYFDLLSAKDAWPEFNLFTTGYMLSRLPYTDSKFADGVAYQWETIDRCVEEKVDRPHLSMAPYMNKATTVGRKRACWNTWIAPHNFEGFFLNMGDMLVKQGHPDQARVVYAQARASNTYDRWPYRDILEARIAAADDNVAKFRQATPDSDPKHAMMIETGFACMGCHQE
jgi:hypothetical protein